jgi:hypothetical protein
MTVIRALMLIGLTHGGARFKGNQLEQEMYVGDMIQEHWLEKGRTVNDLVQIVMDAFIDAGLLPKKDEEEEEEAVKEQTNPTEDG